ASRAPAIRRRRCGTISRTMDRSYPYRPNTPSSEQKSFCTSTTTSAALPGATFPPSVFKNCMDKGVSLCCCHLYSHGWDTNIYAWKYPVKRLSFLQCREDSLSLSISQSSCQGFPVFNPYLRLKLQYCGAPHGQNGCMHNHFGAGYYCLTLE